MASRGKTPNLTPEQERTFLQLMATAMYPAQAARKLGVTPQAISMRKKRDKRFAALFEQSEAGAEFGLVAQMMMAARKDWRAALAMLERRWPERWARPEIRNEITNLNVNTDELAKAISDGLAMMATRYAGLTGPDVDPNPPGAPPKKAGGEPETAAVARS